MAKVLLRNNWWAPSKRLYRKGATKRMAVDVPDELVPYLPSTAEVVGDDYVEPVVEESADTFSEHRKMLDSHDPERAAAEAQAKLAAEAQATQEAQRRENAAKFKEELAAEEKPRKGKKGKV